MASTVCSVALCLQILSMSLVHAMPSNDSTVLIPPELTYNLPTGFSGNANYTFVNGTHTSNSSINDLLQSAASSPFIAYDEEFLEIFGTQPEIKLVQDRSAEHEYFAFEAGVWVPERNEVWFTSSIYQAQTRGVEVRVFNLETGHVGKLNTTNHDVENANGGYYFDGKVYFGTFRNANNTYSGGIVSVDVHTLEVQTVLNSYFGLLLDGPDDLVWVTQTQGVDKGRKYLFFTEYKLAETSWGSSSSPDQLPLNVWRFDPQEKSLIPVITRNELVPNGIRVSPDMRSLYVSDTDPIFLASAPSENTGADSSSWLGPYIYRFDLDEEMFPVNRRTIGQVRDGIADGMHVDDKGRIWTGESGGITVRKPNGKVLGTVNGPFFLQDNSATAIPIANFALAGDTLVVLAVDRLYTVRLAQEVVTSNSSIVN